MAETDFAQWKNGGYAHFPGTYQGPATQGLTCAGCRFSSTTKSKYATFHYCDKATAMKGKRQATIVAAAPACKYWEKRP